MHICGDTYFPGVNYDVELYIALLFLISRLLYAVQFLSAPRSSLANFGHAQAPSNVLVGNSAAATSSPSRFAATGHQGHHQSASVPPVSVPVSHFMASSPSPAASGGSSSVFRDSRLTSSS